MKTSVRWETSCCVTELGWVDLLMLYNDNLAQASWCDCTACQKIDHSSWSRFNFCIVPLLCQTLKFKSQICILPVKHRLGMGVWLQRGTPCLGMLLSWHREQGHQNAELITLRQCGTLEMSLNLTIRRPYLPIMGWDYTPHIVLMPFHLATSFLRLPFVATDNIKAVCQTFFFD